MKTASLLASAAIAAFASSLSASDAGGAWLQLVPAGTFTARDGRGPFTTGGRADLEAIVATTLKYRGQTELVIDYDHQTVFGAVPGVGGTAKAAGWVKQLEVRDDGIWGRVEWTQAAASAIRAGEYRYLSPVFFHTKLGKVLALRMAGLTNDPAFNLAQVAASTLVSELSELSDEGEPMDKIIEALGLEKGAGEDKVLTAINSMLAGSAAITKALGLKDGAKADEVLQAVNSTMADRGKVATSAGLKADATTDEILTAVGSAVKGVLPDPAKFVPIEQVAQIQTDLKAMQEQLVSGKAEEAVASAIKDGKLVPSLKEWGTELAKKDFAAFETFVGSAPTLTGPQLKETKRGDGEDALDDAQIAVCSALGLDPKAYATNLKAQAGKAH